MREPKNIKVKWVGGWFTVQIDFIEKLAKKVGIYAVGVYVVLCKEAGVSGECQQVTVPKICELLAASRSTVFRALKTLEDEGAIGRDSGAEDGDTNAYIIIDLRKGMAKEPVSNGDSQAENPDASSQVTSVKGDTGGCQEVTGTPSFWDTPNKEVDKEREKPKEQAPSVRALVEHFNLRWNEANAPSRLKCDWTNKLAFKRIKQHIENAGSWSEADHLRAIDNYFQSDNVLVSDPPEVAFANGSQGCRMKRYVTYALNRFGNGPKEESNGKASGYSPAAKQERNRTAATEVAFRIINGGNAGGSAEGGPEQAGREEETPAADS